MKRIALILTVLALMAVSHPAHAALQPENVECGEAITTSVRVSNSLFGCAGSGLEVAAGGIVIDLNGHTIDGNRTDDDAMAETEFGIDNGAGFSGVTIRNGTVSGFEVGLLTTGSNNVLEAITAANNADDGIRIQSTDRVKVRGVDAVENGGSGILGESSTRISFKRNRAISNDGAGIRLTGVASTDGVIANNLAEANGVIGIVTASGLRHRILDNVARFNGNDGIESAGTEDHEIIGNVSIGSEDDGFEISGGDDHVVRDNIARANRSDGFEISGNDGTDLIENVALRNGDRGYNISGANNVVRQNRAKDNHSHGLQVTGTDHIITRNVAVRNGFADGVSDGAGLGISAGTVTGLTGTGNEARENDDADECEPTGPPFCV